MNNSESLEKKMSVRSVGAERLGSYKEVEPNYANH